MTTLYYTRDREGNRIGEPVLARVAPYPDGKPVTGRYCRLERLTTDHAEELAAAFAGQHQNWIWLPYGPIDGREAMQRWITETASGDDPLFYTVRDIDTDAATGVLSYLRINPPNRSIEIGHINFSAAMQRSRTSTEAIYLLMKAAFETGYRRLEWKCSILNDKSCTAAERLGLSFEGIFRQADAPKGHNRDTAWFAAIDGEWPRLEEAFERWLDPDNFDDDGKQKISLSRLTEAILVRRLADAGYQFKESQIKESRN